MKKLKNLFYKRNVTDVSENVISNSIEDLIPIVLKIEEFIKKRWRLYN